MVANDRSSVLLGGPYVGWMILVFANVIQGYPGSMNPGILNCLVWLGVLVLWSLFWAACSSGAAKRWKGINDRRQMIARAGSWAEVPLANPHPFPHVAALPLPVTLPLRPTWWLAPAIPCLLASGCVLVDDLVHVGITLLLGSSLSASVHQGMGIRWSFFVLAMLLTIRLLLPQSMEVTAEGLSVHHGAFDWLSPTWQLRKRVMRWDEARLFAIRDGKPGGWFIRYELSSPTTVVTFGRCLQQRWFAAYQPAQPFDDYQAQMDALLALISARTGLPLSDVR